MTLHVEWGEGKRVEVFTEPYEGTELTMAEAQVLMLDRIATSLQRLERRAEKLEAQFARILATEERRLQNATAR